LALGKEGHGQNPFNFLETEKLKKGILGDFTEKL